LAVAVTLSSRERACLSWVANGKSSWEIAAILALSASTVNFHIKNAMKKLRTTSRTVAAIEAVQLGIIEPPSKLESQHRSEALNSNVLTSSYDRRGIGDTCTSEVPQLPPNPYRSCPSGADRNRIRVGVLPFLALRPLRDKAFVWSLTREIAVGLARFRWLDVTGPAPLKQGRSTYVVDDDFTQLDYLIGGVLWNQLNVFQISVRLLDVVNGACEIWSGHFGCTLVDGYQLDEPNISCMDEQINVSSPDNKKCEPERRQDAAVFLSSAVRSIVSSHCQRVREPHREMAGSS
jgi:DNA-binding CsgD family transcriptional regulator/TolB-like protein